MKIIRRLLIGFVCLFISYYLTWTVDKITIENQLQFAFVFLYFFSVILLLCWIFKKYTSCDQIHPKKIFSLLLVSGILAVIILVACSNFFIELYEPMTIRVTALGQIGQLQENQRSTEVWLNRVTVDNQEFNLLKVPLTEGWENRDGVLLSYQNQPNTIVLELPAAKSVSMQFQSHPWCGTVIVDNGVQTEQLDLFNSDPAATNIEIIFNGVIKPFNSLDGVILAFSCFIMLWAISNVLIYLCYKRRQTFLLLYLYLFFVAIYANDEVYLGTSIKVALLITSIVCGLFFNNAIDRTKFSKTSKGLFILLSAYTAFAMVGHQLFLANDLVEASLSKVATFIIWFLYFIPFTYVAIHGINYFAKSIKQNFVLPNERQIRNTRLVLFIIISGILMIMSIGYYPANMTSDGVDQWSQALGLYPINDAHPAAHTLLLRLCASIWENPYLAVIIQILAFSCIISNVLTYFYKKGLSKKLLIIIAVIIPIMPSNFLMITLVSKNTPFALAIWWLMYLLIQMIDNPAEFFHHPSKYIQMIIALSLIDLLRHNGFLAVIFVNILLIVFMLKHFNKFKALPLIIVFGVLFVTEMVQGPVYKAFGVNQSTSNVSGPLLSPFGSAIKNNVELPEDILIILEEIAPLEQWKETYNKYNNDKFSWSNPRPNFKSITTSEAFKMYIRLLGRYPDIVIKDRLDKMNLVWNVAQPLDGGESLYSFGIWTSKWITPEALPKLLNSDYAHNGGEQYYRENLLTKALSFISGFSSSIEIADVFIWRNGFYVIIFLLLILLSVSRKRYNIIWISLPSFATLLTYVLMMGWPIYQYLWFFPLSMFILVLYALTDDEIELNEVARLIK